MKQKAISIKMWVMLALLCGFAGCSLRSNKASDAERVFAATEVGTPEGAKVTKDIGPAGGTLASPDGRLTLTVPQGALTETLPFSIQPITNKAGGGIGLAYRLEPDGKTFTTPLQISVRYDDKDLEGTVPEALLLAYQDEQGAWHEMKSLNQTEDTLTVATTHFTDWSFLSRLRISPEKATVRVGETVQLKFGPCHHQQNGIVDRLRRWAQGTRQPCEVTDRKNHWKINPNWFVDIGTINPPREITVTYTAPSKKPNPNIATVSLPYELEAIDSGNSWGGGTYKSKRGMFLSKITIVDRGYKPSEQVVNGSVLSGVICSFEKPFTINLTNSLFTFDYKFVPSGATTGTVSFAGSFDVIDGKVTMNGSGSYTIEGADTDKPRIRMQVTTIATTRHGGVNPGSLGYIDLVPLETDECN